jgi:hypothetical protein
VGWSISSLSLENLKVPVSDISSGAAVDVTDGSTVEFAFTAVGAEPESSDWTSGTWETDSTREPDRYYARCLVGPSGSIELADGVYWVWVKIAGVGSEIPVRRVDTLTVT